MTEEIIIDGVDVAGCKNYVHIEEERYKPECNCRLTTVERGYYCDTYATSICEEKDCEYKQLKRLEQENETLNYQWHKQYEIADEWYKVAEKYKSTLEEIREIAKFNLFYNPDFFSINGDIGQIQNLKMTEIYNKIIEVLQ